jgi:hypothetical protein
MLARLRFLKGATALLYFGPLLAGLSGFGWAQIPYFVAIFVLWLVIVRPEQWPETLSEWLTPRAIVAALTQVLSQILLVTILFAVGRGIGGVAGFLPILNASAPLAMSFFAIPLSRTFWDSRKAAEVGVFLDEEAEQAQTPRAAAHAALAIVPLLNLPDDVPAAEVNSQVTDVMFATGAALRLNALTASLRRTSRSHAALRRALVTWATEPEVVASGLVPDAVSNAFSIANGNPDLLRLLVPRALALINAFPNRAPGFPAPDLIRQTAAGDLDGGPMTNVPAHLLDDLRGGMGVLAQAIERAQTEQRPAATDPARRALTDQVAARHA